MAPLMPPPLVSIITLSYNYARYIEQAIRSVLAQTYPNWELVIVDDGSQDDSLSVIRRFDDPRIVVLPLPSRHGACRAYNIAYAQCRGTYLGTVDADDLYLPEKLDRQVALLEARPDLDVVGTWIVQIDAGGREVDGANAAAVNQPRDLNALDSWVPSDLLTHSSALIRKSTHDRVGGLNPQLHLAPDFELWLRFLAHGGRFTMMPERLTAYRSHPANVSHTHDRRELWLELCFLFAAHLAPMLVRRGRQDLFAPALSGLAATIADAGIGLRTLVFRRLAQFPLLPRDYETFRARVLSEIESQHAEAWARLAPAAVPAASPPRSPARPARPVSARLSIVDDFFPDLVTGFRLAEFNWYLEHLDCAVYSTNPDFDRVWRDYAAVYPHLADRVRRLDPARAADCSLLYCVFLNNAYALLPLAERWRLPLVFTLYPGGGFEMFHGASDLMLSRLARSERVRRIIVTQRATRDYVLNGGFALPDQLELIWGLPTQGAAGPSAPLAARRHWPAEKPTLDVCFAALKYMQGGADKGYDTFVASARRLAELDPCFRFHVAGSFGPDDADLGALGQRITFHGTQPAHRLSEFFAGMDLIISPNVRFRLTPGGFDGFPTGTCTEAALNGVAVLCTDPFSENADRHFVDDEDLCIVDADPGAIVNRVMALRADPGRLHRLARRGQERCREIYGVEGQLAPRLSVLTDCMWDSRAAPAPS